MRWLDVAGPPGVGKSTLCDALWPPDAIVPDDQPFPEEWSAFLKCTDRLLEKVSGHPSYHACRSMIGRSFRKMATVSRMAGEQVYIQTGFAQRGLGLGWRLKDTALVAEYFALMPVSVGVALLKADVVTVQRRNVERGKDRSFMVPIMEPVMAIAAETLKARGVPLIELDTREPVARNIDVLHRFAADAVHARPA